jgi:peptidoglycan/LPS O-acetylase OafA/YrhL
MSLPSSADSSPPITPEAITKKGKLNAIDAIRGWAIFLVITAHVGGLFPELPWPLKKITNFGWYGVQLFFVASAFTLMLSWERMQQGFIVKTANFFFSADCSG